MSDKIGVARAGFARPSYRPARPGAIDPDLLRMALVAVAICGVLALAVGASSMLRRGHHGVPVIEPLAGPVRIKPADPGGMKVMGAGDAAPAGAAEKLAPPPERPQIAALRARVRAAHLSPIAASPAPQKASAVVPAPVLPAPVLPAPVLPAPVLPAPVVPALVAKGPAVQLAAFDSADLAEQDWGRLATRMPALFGSRKPEVVRAEVHGRTLWRLRTGGFASDTQALDFCAKVRAQGGDCSLAAF
jgi:hypothetical protein